MIPLPDDEAHVWLVDVRGARSEVCSEMVPQAELERVSSFRLKEMGEAYLAQRAALRGVLAAYLDRAAQDICFGAEKAGKPVLLGADADVTFNLSHSGRFALVGIARRRRIGIDVQIEKLRTPCLDLARRFFAPEEFEWLEGLDAAAQTRAFFALWTAKEAYLKATGDGLAGGLNRFCVRIDDQAAPHLMRVDGQPDASERWTIRRLTCAEDYAAAIAIECRHVRIRRAEWRFGDSVPHSGLLREEL